MRIHVPGFDAICRMAEAAMGLGVVPFTDPWARRVLHLVVRPGALPPAAALLLDHLRRAA